MYTLQWSSIHHWSKWLWCENLSNGEKIFVRLMNTIYHHEDQPQFNGKHTSIQETIKYTNIGFLDLFDQ
jgi:hypothetical protein